MKEKYPVQTISTFYPQALIPERISLTLLERFLNDSEKALKPSTKKSYRRILARFINWLLSQGITAPGRDNIKDYKALLQGQGLKAGTVSTYLAAIKSFFKWLEAELIYPNVSHGIKAPRVEKGFKKKALSINQVKELLLSIDRTSLEGKRDYALINLMVRTGLRTIEIIRADIGDIDSEQGQTVLRIWGKGREGKDDLVVLTSETERPIREYLAARGEGAEETPLFGSLSDRNRGGRLSTRSIRRIVKAYLGGVGLIDQRITTHSLRHTTATLALLAGASIQETQAIMRHSDVNITLKNYAHNLKRVLDAPEKKIDELLGVA